MLLASRALMIQGTTSDAGKSLLVVGLCRWLARNKVSVTPFKPQNMALNSAVTHEGGEIGRAQALQAQAAKIPPSIYMNPVLLKPTSNEQSQIIVLGQAIELKKSIGYQSYKAKMLPIVMSAFSHLLSLHETIIIEGAGSPAEINLRENDIANMGFAEEADIPVILIADIDRGGVFAHLYGTLALLSESEQARIKGFVINRFRGDLSLLQSGIDWLEKKTGKPVFGVLPYLMDLRLDEEDGLVQQTMAITPTALKVGIFVYPRISNHSDFDPLLVHPDVDVIFIRAGDAIPCVDLLILPGTKQVQDDLRFFRQQHWDLALARHLRYGGKVMGICGGYQMLGLTIDDPSAVEGKVGCVNGLGYLPIHTQFEKQKILRQRVGTLHLSQQPPVLIEGYEIHAGRTSLNGLTTVIEFNDNTLEGCISEDEQIIGTYLHGLFDQAESCRTWLRWAGQTSEVMIDWQAIRESNIDRVADMLDKHLNLAAIFESTTHSFHEYIQDTAIKNENM